MPPSPAGVRERVAGADDGGVLHLLADVESEMVARGRDLARETLDDQRAARSRARTAASARWSVAEYGPRPRPRRTFRTSRVRSTRRIAIRDPLIDRSPRDRPRRSDDREPQLAGVAKRRGRRSHSSQLSLAGFPGPCGGCRRAETPLPRPIAPGEATKVAFRVEAPGSPGEHILEIDLVEESVSWFTAAGVAGLRVHAPDRVNRSGPTEW